MMMERDKGCDRGDRRGGIRMRITVYGLIYGRESLCLKARNSFLSFSFYLYIGMGSPWPIVKARSVIRSKEIGDLFSTQSASPFHPADILACPSSV